MSKNAVTLRLGVEGDQRVMDALRKIGQQGTEEFKKLPKEAQRAARSFDALERSLDPATKSAHQLAKAYVDAERAVATGARTHEEAARVLDIAAQRHKIATQAAQGLTRGMNDNAHATGLARHELVNLGRQIGDIGTMLASGSSPFQVLATQGAQVAEIFSTSKAGAGAALKDFASISGRLALKAGPIAIVAGLLGEAAHAALSYQSSVDSLTLSLNGLGRQAGLTMTQVMRLADANAGRMSNADARGLAGQFLGAGAPAAAVGGALGVASDMQRKLGLDMESVGKTLSDALADPARGAEQLAKQYGLVYFEEEQHIKQLAAVGERSKAAAELIAVLQQNMKGLEDPTWKAVDAIGLLKKGLSDWQDDLGKNLNEWFFGRRNIARWEAEAQKRADENRLKAEADVAARREADLAKLREDGQFAVREIQARTFAERDLLAQQRAYQQTLRDTNDAVKASISAENERARMLAESRRRIDDYAQGGARALEMARMSPYERGRQQIRNEYKDLVEQFLPTSATTPAVIGMNNVAKSAQRAATALETVAGVASGRRTLGEPALGSSTTGDANNRPLGRLSDPRGMSGYIRERALAYGIDPDTALRVAGSEGLGSFIGDHGTSFGAFQLHIGGRAGGKLAVGGLGDSFRRSTGLDPSDPANERATIDYALSVAAKQGWGPWYGAAKVGIHGFDGIGGRGAATQLSPTIDVGGRRRGLGVIDAARNDNGFASMRGAAEKGLNDRLAAFDYEQITAVLKGANDEIDRQRSLLDANTQTWGQSAEAVARAAKEQELLNQFQQQGIPVNDALRAQIGETAAKYGELVGAQERVRESQQRIVAGLDEIRSSSQQFASGFISDIRRGASETEALSNALERLSDRMIDMALDQMITGLFGGKGKAGGGMFGDLLGGLLGGGLGGGSGGGFLSGILGGLGGGLGGGLMAPFADGGIMTSRGPVKLSANRGGLDDLRNGPRTGLAMRRENQLSGGGIARSPQVALFGEGSTPEAYVPVPSGRIPVNLRMSGGGAPGPKAAAPRVVVEDHSGGLQIRSYTTPEEVRIMIQAYDREATRALGARVQDRNRRAG